METNNNSDNTNCLSKYDNSNNIYKKYINKCKTVNRTNAFNNRISDEFSDLLFKTLYISNDRISNTIYLTKNSSITMKTIINHKNLNWDWDWISNYKIKNIDEIVELEDKLNFNILASNINFSLDWYEKFKYKKWNKKHILEFFLIKLKFENLINYVKDNIDLMEPTIWSKIISIYIDNKDIKSILLCFSYIKKDILKELLTAIIEENNYSIEISNDKYNVNYNNIKYNSTENINQLIIKLTKDLLDYASANYNFCKENNRNRIIHYNLYCLTYCSVVNYKIMKNNPSIPWSFCAFLEIATKNDLEEYIDDYNNGKNIFKSNDYDYESVILNFFEDGLAINNNIDDDFIVKYKEIFQSAHNNSIIFYLYDRRRLISLDTIFQYFCKTNYDFTKLINIVNNIEYKIDIHLLKKYPNFQWRYLYLKKIYNIRTIFSENNLIYDLKEKYPYIDWINYLIEDIEKEDLKKTLKNINNIDEYKLTKILNNYSFTVIELLRFSIINTLYPNIDLYLLDSYNIKIVIDIYIDRLYKTRKKEYYIKYGLNNYRLYYNYVFLFSNFKNYINYVITFEQFKRLEHENFNPIKLKHLEHKLFENDYIFKLNEKYPNSLWIYNFIENSKIPNLEHIIKYPNFQYNIDSLSISSFDKLFDNNLIFLLNYKYPNLDWIKKILSRHHLIGNYLTNISFRSVMLSAFTIDVYYNENIPIDTIYSMKKDIINYSSIKNFSSNGFSKSKKDFTLKNIREYMAAYKIQIFWRSITLNPKYKIGRRKIYELYDNM